MKRIYTILFSACIMLFGASTSVKADIDMSEYYSNLGFEDGNFDGWSTDYPISGMWPATDDYYSSLVTNYALKAYFTSTLSASTIISQGSTSALPAGTYKITAVVHAEIDGFYLYATDGSTTEMTPITSTSEWAVADTYEVDITLTSDATLTIGLKTTDTITPSSGVNIYADNFTVTQTITDAEGDEWEVASEFTNLDFESHVSDDSAEECFPGWTVKGFESNYENGYTYLVKMDSYASSLVYNYLLSAWVPTSYISNIAGDFIYQSAQVSAGTYKVSAVVHCENNGTTLTLFAKDGDGNEVTTDIETNSVWSNAATPEVTITMEEAGALTIGLRLSGTPTSDVNIYADNFSVTSEEITIEVTSAGYATYYSEHSYTMPDGLQGAIVKSYDSGEDGTGSIALTYQYESGDVVPAKTPIVVKGGAGTYHGNVLSESGDAPEDNYLYGSTVATKTNVDGDENSHYFYKLAQASDGSVGFYYGAPEGAAFDIAAHRAWLAISKNSGVKLAGFVFTEDNGDSTAGISAVKTTATGTDTVYNLQGMRVSDTQKKGLYIIGGKKVIVK